MCYIHGSIEQAIGICPMCKVFKPTASRCPHVKDVCRNRQLHPAFDIIYLKNAEVLTFQGCGYCKWARANPSMLKSAGYANPGWPGCCRAPNASEQLLIPPADWHAVSIVHKVSTPPEIKALLESARNALASPQARANGGQASPKTAQPSLTTTPPKPSVALAKQPAPLVIPAKARGGSPKQASSPLGRDGTRGTGSGPSPVMPSAELRRTTSARDSSPGSKASSVRRSMEQDSTIRRSGERMRKPQPSASSLAVSMAQVALGDERPGLKRRSSEARQDERGASPASPPNTRFADVKNTPTATPRMPRKIASQSDVKPRKPVYEAPAPAKTSSKLAPSSRSSDGSTSSTLSESTITSEGFTDYLSDESDLELQRQAEVAAAQVTQGSTEDQEFRAARKQLAQVDLHPPRAWNSATVGTRAGKALYQDRFQQPARQINVMELARSK